MELSKLIVAKLQIFRNGQNNIITLKVKILMILHTIQINFISIIIITRNNRMAGQQFRKQSVEVNVVRQEFGKVSCRIILKAGIHKRTKVINMTRARNSLFNAVLMSMNSKSENKIKTTKQLFYLLESKRKIFSIELLLKSRVRIIFCN